MLKRLYIVLIVVFLAACSSSPVPNNNQNPPFPTLPTDPNAPAPTDPTNPTPTPPNPNDDGTCTYVLSKDITVPSTLVNTPNLCDYTLEGFVEVSSTLTIEPGVVIRAKQDAILWVDGGQVLAVGTPEQRIVMEGLNHIAGYWDGIRYTEGRESKFEYFDLKDAGQVCTILWCPDAALILDDVTVSFANSTVSNSYVHGLHATGDVLFTKFENNRFYNNIWAGIVIDGEYASVLDSASDYSGGAEPNGTPYVLLASGDLETGAERVWKKLNAPYLIGGYLGIEGGVVTLEPGVTVVFGESDWITVRGNGELRAIGTPTERITFKGLKEEAGYWDGITFWDSDWEKNELSYVTIQHSGSTGKALNAFGAIRLRYQSTLTINNSIISDNAQHAIACDEQSSFVGSPKLTLGEGNLFERNGLEDVDPVCQEALQ